MTIQSQKKVIDQEVQLTPRQDIWYKSPCQEQLVGGAAGAGKSMFMRLCCIMAGFTIPNCQIYMFRRTRGELIQNHVEGESGFVALLGDYIKAGLVSYNKTDNCFTFHQTGAKIFLCYCEKPGDVIKYQGVEIQMLVIDELTQWNEADYRFLRARMRASKEWTKNVPEMWWRKIGTKAGVKKSCKFPWILTSSNPGGIGHDWVKRTFVDPGTANQPFKVVDDEGGMLRGFYPALLSDNPHLNHDEYTERLKGMGKPHLVKAWLEGDWNIVSDGMFSDVFMAKTHVLEPFEIPHSWHFDYTFDWGYSKPYSVGFWAESDGTPVTLSDGTEFTFPKGTVIRIAELYGCDAKKPNTGLRHSAEEISKLIKEKMGEAGLRNYKFKPGVADHNIFNGDKPEIKTYKADGHNFTKADKAPGSRVNGWMRMRQLFDNAALNPKEEPGLYVFDTCKNFIRTVPVLQRDTKNMDDVDSSQEDHIADECRYRLLNTKKGFAIVSLLGY